MARIPPDNNDVLVLHLNGGPFTFTNTGTAGTAANWQAYGSVVPQATGLLDLDGDFGALYVPGSNISSTRSGAGGASETVISPNISISGWVFLRRIPPSYGVLFMKQYFKNGWSNPFLTIGFQMTNNVNGQYFSYISTNGILRSITTPFTYALAIGKWYHMGLTWDGTTFRSYLNGVLMGSTASFSGTTIDFGTAGNRGLWSAGGIPGSTVNEEAAAIIQDVRVASIVRPQSYFADIYYNGFIP